MWSGNEPRAPVWLANDARILVCPWGEVLSLIDKPGTSAGTIHVFL